MSRAKDLAKKAKQRVIRKKRVRAKISGNAEFPRVTIFKSNKFLYAQAIDDAAGVTLASVNSKTMGLSVSKENAEKVAVEFAKALTDKGIATVKFDKNGYLYHGVVKAFADALRDNGIKL
jgi:large subunit ribosomal protein L18